MTAITTPAVRLPRVASLPTAPRVAATPAPAPAISAPASPGSPAPTAGPHPLEVVSVALEWATVGLVVLTALSTSILGPFGVLPALLIGPVFLAAELIGWMAAQATPAPEPARMPPAVEVQPASTPAPRPTAEPEERAPRRPTLRTHLRERLREVQRVHHTLPTLLAAVRSQQDPLHVLLQLQALRRHLEEHFQSEEAPGGLFEELRCLSEDVEQDLGVLADQHEAILADLQALTDLQALEDPAAAAALPALDQVLERIQIHQRNEDTLVQQVYGFRVEGDLGS